MAYQEAMWRLTCLSVKVHGPVPITFEYLGESFGHERPHVTIRATMNTIDSSDEITNHERKAAPALKPFLYQVDVVVPHHEEMQARHRELFSIAAIMVMHELQEHFICAPPCRSAWRPFEPHR